MALSPRILYVDDDVDGLEMMVYWLTNGFGYDVTAAADGREAKQFIDQEVFDLYLLDYCLPDTTAISLCRHIKLVNPDAPIIIYSALDRDIDKVHALDAGADCYFVKPEEMELVGSRIRSIFGRRTIQLRAHNNDADVFYRASGHLHNRRKAAGIV